MGSQWLNRHGQLATFGRDEGLVLLGELYGISSGAQGVLAVGTDIVGLFRGIAGYTYHANISVIASVDCEVRIIEGPTVGSSGTEDTVFNQDRGSTNALHGTFYSSIIAASSVVSATGTTLWKQYISAGIAAFGAGQQSIGGMWEFAENTVYGLLVNPFAAGSFCITMNAQEHATG